VQFFGSADKQCQIKALKALKKTIAARRVIFREDEASAGSLMGNTRPSEERKAR